MRIATLLFTYNRPIHTSEVLDALSRNTITPEKLYIFHDGKKSNTSEQDWNAVEEVIRRVNWCDCSVITSEKNNGLANSIVSGVNRIFSDYDAIIVLEDDCVPHRLFMKYMTDALYKYIDKKRVYSIGATAEPVEVPDNGYDAYFCGRIRSTGWATWRDRWDSFDKDYEILGRIKKNASLLKWLHVWGQDLEAMLYDNILGKIDSWAVFWALNVISKKGLALTPYHSLINNIGYDLSGIHSGGVKPDLKPMPVDQVDVLLPDEVEAVPNYEKVFAWFFPWFNPIDVNVYYKKVLCKWIDSINKGNHLFDWFIKNNVHNIYIWGMGELGRLVVEELQDKLNIIAIIETIPSTDSCWGIKVISCKDIQEEFDRIVIIPGYDIERIIKLTSEKLANRMICIDQLL